MLNLILKPFSWLLTTFCLLFGNNYGLALILFALVVKIILFPFSLKGKRSMVKMSAVQGKASRIQRQYANNKQKQQEELAKLYEKENVNPMGGCLWSFLPLLLLLPLYAIIRQPLAYMMNATAEQITTLLTTLDWSGAAAANNWAADFTKAPYGQLQLASLVNEGNLSAVQGVVPGAFAINFRFLGMNLAQQPTWAVWEPTYVWNWNNIGLTLMPIVSAALSLLMSVVTQKTNKMSNPNAEQQNGSNTFMLYIFSPLMSLWIGYAMPAGLCVYWIINSLLSMVQELISGKMLKKDYEEAAENARKQALLDKEEEKRRKAALSAERSKRIEEQKKQKGKKKNKSAAEPGVDKSASTVGLRTYARGRAYDPHRYGEVTPYRDPDHPIDEDAIEKARAQREEEAEEAKLEADVTAQVAAEMEALSAGTAEEVEKAIEASEEQRDQALLDEAEVLAAAVKEAADETGDAPAGDESEDAPQD